MEEDALRGKGAFSTPVSLSQLPKDKGDGSKDKESNASIFHGSGFENNRAVPFVPFARERYEADRASYHVSGRLDKAPLSQEVRDSDPPALLDQFDAREILHVTFGSVLTARTEDGHWHFYDRLMGLLRAHAEAYATNLEAHFLRHLIPFVERRPKPT